MSQMRVSRTFQGHRYKGMVSKRYLYLLQFNLTQSIFTLYLRNQLIRLSIVVLEIFMKSVKVWKCFRKILFDMYLGNEMTFTFSFHNITCVLIIRWSKFQDRCNILRLIISYVYVLSYHWGLRGNLYKSFLTLFWQY